MRITAFVSFYPHHRSPGSPRLQTTLSTASSPSASSLIYTSTSSPKTSEQHTLNQSQSQTIWVTAQGAGIRSELCVRPTHLTHPPPTYQSAPITTLHSTWLSLVSFRALFWSVPLSPLEQNCFLLAAQPQMQAEETRRSTMCCRSRSDSTRAHSFFFFFFSFSFGSSLASFICVNYTFFSSAFSPSPIHFSSLFITSDSLDCSPHGKRLWSCCAALSPWN